MEILDWFTRDAFLAIKEINRDLAKARTAAERQAFRDEIKEIERQWFFNFGLLMLRQGRFQCSQN